MQVIAHMDTLSEIPAILALVAHHSLGVKHVVEERGIAANPVVELQAELLDVTR